MLETIFKQALKWEQEVGLTNDPADKGGVTNDGITWEHYFALCKRILNVVPTLAHFKTLTEVEVHAFYAYSFAEINCDKITNTVVAAVCFDFALNSLYGKREIQRLLKGLGYTLNADNEFGPVSISAINRATETMGAAAFVNAIMDRRVAYVQQIVKRDSTQKKFLAGWLNRIADWRNWAHLNIS